MDVAAGVPSKVRFRVTRVTASESCTTTVIVEGDPEYVGMVILNVIIGCTVSSYGVVVYEGLDVATGVNCVALPVMPTPPFMGVTVQSTTSPELTISVPRVVVHDNVVVESGAWAYAELEKNNTLRKSASVNLGNEE